MNVNDLIYDVDLWNETVECKVQHCKSDFMRITDKILSQYPEHIRYFYKFITSYYCEKIIKDEYIGKSICSSRDIFNENYGKDLARTKAIIKREQDFNRALDAIFNDIEVLMDVNTNIDRDSVLDKHLDNMCDLLENGKSLAEIRGYNRNEDKDKCVIINNIDLNKDYTPHHCALCGKTFLNYKDDKDYLSNEHNWWLLNMPLGKKMEMCSSCVDTIRKLSD